MTSRSSVVRSSGDRGTPSLRRCDRFSKWRAFLRTSYRDWNRSPDQRSVGKVQFQTKNVENRQFLISTRVSRLSRSSRIKVRLHVSKRTIQRSLPRVMFNRCSISVDVAARSDRQWRLASGSGVREAYCEAPFKLLRSWSFQLFVLLVGRSVSTTVSVRLVGPVSRRKYGTTDTCVRNVERSGVVLSLYKPSKGVTVGSWPRSRCGARVQTITRVWNYRESRDSYGESERRVGW